MNWNFNKSSAQRESNLSELRQKARERVKHTSFWLNKPRDGWTKACWEESPLMSAGPCGNYTPRFDHAEPIRTKTLSSYRTTEQDLSSCEVTP